MKSLIPLAFLAPIPAYAAEIVCMPEKICFPGTCDGQINEESSLRLTHPDSIAPTLLSHGENITMTKTYERNGISEWNGLNAQGEHEILLLDRPRMAFTYSIGGEFVQYVGRKLRYKSLGKCEIQ